MRYAEIIKRYNKMNAFQRSMVVRLYGMKHKLTIRETAKHFNMSVGKAHYIMKEGGIGGR